MTRVHFSAAASIVRSILNGEWTNDAPDWCDGRLFPGETPSPYVRAVQTAEAFLALAASTNPRFDRDRFLVACGLKEGSRDFPINTESDACRNAGRQGSTATEEKVVMPRYTKTEQAEALARLHDWLKPGDTVYTILDHVSAFGTSRTIRVVLLSCENGKAIDLHPNHAVSRVLGLRFHKRNGRETDALVVQGCGMDMGFYLVHNLSRRLFPDGFGCIGPNCPSNDHSNGDRDHTPHVACDCSRCAVCGGRTICARCEMCTRCHQHREGCEGCPERQHWHTDGGYALRHRWL